MASVASAITWCHWYSSQHIYLSLLLTGRLPAGICFGRTPLIKISPKKTWEGFLGGLLLTIASAWLLADLMSRFQWMTCPRTVSNSEICH